MSVISISSMNDNELISILNKITIDTKLKLSVLNTRLSYYKYDSLNYIKLQNEINNELTKWTNKVRVLGCVPVALGKVRISREENNYLWSHPDKNLSEY